ncbi:MAG: sugar phosphate isomerase/epimerase [Acidobacteria bacterium]|nr:sugar phosphate isomerase/epimerase [Acidobacteriota bacterium]
MTRRHLLAAAPAALAATAWAKKSKLRIGVTDWNLRLSGKIEAVELAARLGFQGVEVSLGRTPVDGKLHLDNAELQQQYLAAAKKQKIALAGTCLDILHVNCGKNDKLALKWIADGIPITKKLKARVMLMPFFGPCALATAADFDYVGDALRELGQEAEKAGVLLGLENTISARDNVRIMERSRSKAVQVYYDVGNSTRAGHDILAEIPWLGASRICQFHLKDQGYMGEGKIDFPEVMKRIMDLGFTGFANLETGSPSKSIENDMKRNLNFVRGLIG